MGINHSLKENKYDFTAARCFRANADDSLEINKDTGIHTLPIVVSSNQTTHEPNIVAQRIKLCRIIKPGFWSEVNFVLNNFSDSIGAQLKARHTKMSPHGKLSSKMQNILQCANMVCNIHIGYIDQTKIKNLNLYDSIYIYGTLQIMLMVFQVTLLSFIIIQHITSQQKCWKGSHMMLLMVMNLYITDDTRNNGRSRTTDTIELDIEEVVIGQWVKIVMNSL